MFIANNAKIIGGVNVGNDSVIGVSSVVTKDIPDKANVYGIPAQIASFDGSNLYIGSILKQ